MKVFYEDIDGKLHPKLLIIPFSEESQSSRVQIDLTAPFERMNPEDFHNDFKALTISQGEMLRHHHKEMTILIDIKLVQSFMENNQIHPSMIFEVEYFIMLLDDIEDVLQMNVKRFYLE